MCIPPTLIPTTMWKMQLGGCTTRKHKFHFPRHAPEMNVCLGDILFFCFILLFISSTDWPKRVYHFSIILFLAYLAKIDCIISFLFYIYPQLKESRCGFYQQTLFVLHFQIWYYMLFYIYSPKQSVMLSASIIFKYLASPNPFVKTTRML